MQKSKVVIKLVILLLLVLFGGTVFWLTTLNPKDTSDGIGKPLSNSDNQSGVVSDGKNLSGSLSTGTTNSTGGVDGGTLTGSTSSGSVSNNDAQLKEELVKLKGKKIILSGDELGEIEKGERLYSRTPDEMFYILKYVETKDLSYCDKIISSNRTSKNNVTNYCKNIFSNGTLNEEAIHSFVKKDGLSSDTITLYKIIIQGDKDCSKITEGVAQYSLCKKFLNKDFDVKSTFVNYEKIVSGNQALIKSNLDYFIGGLGLESDIRGVLSNFLSTKPKNNSN